MNAESRVENKFRKVHSELTVLENKIYEKSGFLFFKSHIYTIEELLNSPHHQKVFSITEKIGDDMRNWFRVGKLSNSEEESYYTQREHVDTKLHHINNTIKQRKPTWWEKTKAPLMQFVDLVLDNLPTEFQRDMIASFNKVLIPLFKKIPRLLSFKRS